MEMFAFDHAERLPHHWEGQVARLLEAVDGEFIPPLSSRTSTRDTKLVGSSFRGLADYLAGIASQGCVIARSGDVLAGLLSYMRDATIPEIGLVPPSAYVSTIGVLARFRRLGLADALYAELEAHVESGTTIATRTWSSNDSHLELLRKRGYLLVREIPGDRPGNLATVYYAREVAS